MYYYIYDQFLSQKKYDKILAQIEGKITDLEIKDRIIKISILKSVKELVSDALRKGANTIIAVGNDQTINQVVNLAVGHDVVVGIIPIDKNNSIANFLGIINPLEACEIIAARKIEPINLGIINSSEYFINSVKIYDHQASIECDNKFTISAENNKVVSVYNFLPTRLKQYLAGDGFNPQDNFLEIIVEPSEKDTLNFIGHLFKNKKDTTLDSVFHVKNISIKSKVETKNGLILVDNFKSIKPPIEIKISHKKIKMIVGKERSF